jgi:inward rectifier potassium channel
MMKEKKPRDLGFGAVVGAERQQRLLNRDGSFTVGRRGLGLRAALNAYFRLLTMRWPTFIGVVVALFLALNAIFGLAYLACGPEGISGAGEHGFRRTFFFSVHTLTTIGYGHMAPASLATDVLVLVEAMVGVIGFAIVTGIVFARFSRPHADIVFSRQAVIAPYPPGSDGGHALMFRIANRRHNQIIELEAKVFLSILDRSTSPPKRRFERLALERDRIPFFPMSWTVVHPIEGTSPLAGLTAEDLERGGTEVMVLLTGIDETFFQTVHTRTSYKASEIAWHARFQNMFEQDGSGAPSLVDVARIHDIESDGHE